MNFYQTIYKKIYGDFNIWTDVNCDANKIDLQGWGGDHQIFKQINDSLSVNTGPSYFNEFTKFCCENLGVKFALVGIYNLEKN